MFFIAFPLGANSIFINEVLFLAMTSGCFFFRQLDENIVSAIQDWTVDMYMALVWNLL